MANRFEHLYIDSEFNPFNFSAHSSKDHRFYKYRSDLGHHDRNLKMISSGDIWFASPNSFNDPFDCLPASYMQSEKFENYLFEMARNDAEYSELSDDELKVTVADLVEQQNNLHAEDEISVFSLSKTPIDQLMWAYYGNQHEGFVVEYDISLEAEMTDPDWLFPLPVVYREQRPVSPSYDDPLEYYLIKSEVWRHEEEHRIFRLKNAHLGNMKLSQIRSVILGARANNELREKLEEEIAKTNEKENLDIAVYIAKLSNREYKVTVPNHDLYG